MLAGKEKLCLIRPLGEALALETLFVQADVRDHAEIDEAVAGAELKKPELDLAKQIIDSLAAPFEPEELKSEYRESLRELLEAKLAGKEFELPVEAEPAPVVDLMAALRASVEAASAKPRLRRPGRRRSPPQRRSAQRLLTPVLARARVSAGRGRAPSACNCAWKRVLSIFPW